MSGKKRHALGAALLLVVLLAVAGTIFWWSVRGPLAGETYHDFGRVAVEGRTATVEHVFELTNRTRRTIDLVEVIPSCGCTTVDVSDRTIEPGEPLELTVALTVANGTRKKSITLIVDDGERERTQTLWVKATGKASRTLSATRAQLPLPGDGQWARVTIRHETLKEATPPAPAVEAPDGVEAVFGGWERSGRSSNPVRWTGTLRARAAVADGTLPATVVLRLGEQRLAIELVADLPEAPPAEGP